MFNELIPTFKWLGHPWKEIAVIGPLFQSVEPLALLQMGTMLQYFLRTRHMSLKTVNDLI